MATKIKDIKIALEKSDGVVAQAAKKLNITRQALHDRIQKNPMLKEFHEAVKESTIDLAETALHTALRNGEGWAVCFKLKCHGKSRGYVEKQEHDHTVRMDSEITVKLVDVDGNRDTEKT